MTRARQLGKRAGDARVRQAYRNAGPAAARGLLVLAAVAAMGACHRHPEKAAGSGRAPEQAAAKLNGETIWVSDVKREAVSQGLVGAGETLEPSSDLFHQVLDELVDQKLLAAEAVRQRLDKDPGVQRQLAAARERVLGDRLVEAEVAQAVNDKAIATLYSEQLKRSTQGQELHARQIVVRSQADGEAVKKLLLSGASFQMLAMDRSVDPNTRFNGGDLGYFTLDVMPQAYGQVLGAAKIGDVVGPFPVEGGYALVKVEDRRLQPPVTLAQARPQIVRFLTYDQVRDMLQRLRAKAKIKVLVTRREAAAPISSGPPAGLAPPQPAPAVALPGALPGAAKDAPAIAPHTAASPAASAAPPGAQQRSRP